MTTEAIIPLRQRMIEDMSGRKLCAATQRGHISSCKRFAAFLKRSPDTATCEDIRSFQLHLVDTRIRICNPGCGFCSASRCADWTSPKRSITFGSRRSFRS